MPYVHIYNLKTENGVVSDNKGMFSFIVKKNDTILFTRIGLKRQQIVIPDSLSEPFFYKDIMLEYDTIMIREVRIFPWKTYEEFKKAFAELEIEDKDMENAIKNIAMLKSQIYLDQTPVPTMNHNFIMHEQYNNMYNRGMAPSTQLVNPLAWARFIDAVKKGELKIQKKKYKK